MCLLVVACVDPAAETATAGAREADRPFRPLRGGIAISNPSNHGGKLGTLGMVATSDGLDRWIVSAYHVLGREGTEPFADGEGISQPWNTEPVAFVSSARAHRELDCAAARIATGVGAVGEILGIGPLAPPIEPVVGLRVMKMGRTTGLTEGTISKVSENQIEIVPLARFPPEYEVADVGDSGAVWVEQWTHAPVALHVASEPYGPERAFAVPINKVLTTLGLTALVSDP
jgi:hypothetical protein